MTTRERIAARLFGPLFIRIGQDGLKLFALLRGIQQKQVPPIVSPRRLTPEGLIGDNGDSTKPNK